MTDTAGGGDADIAGMVMTQYAGEGDTDTVGGGNTDALQETDMMRYCRGGDNGTMRGWGKRVMTVCGEAADIMQREVMTEDSTSGRC